MSTAAASTVSVKIKLAKGKSAMFDVGDIHLTSLGDEPVTEDTFEVKTQGEAQAILNGITEQTIVVSPADKKKVESLLSDMGVEVKAPAKKKADYNVTLALSNNRPIWATTDQEIVLNRLTGRASIQLDLEKLTPQQLREVKMGVAYGFLMKVGGTEAAELEKTATSTTEPAFDLDKMFAAEDKKDKFITFMLDYPLDELETMFEKGVKRIDLVQFNRVEMRDRKREEYLKLIKKYLELAE